MQKAVLQVPLPKSLKVSAEAVALEQGFSSLQEAVRLFLKRFANRMMTVTFEEPEVIRLSKKAKERYRKMDEDFKQGRNWHTANSLDEFFKQLDDYSLSSKVSKKL